MTDDPRTIVVSAYVALTDMSAVPRVTEVFTRAAIGLALDGVNVNITLNTIDDDDEDGDDGPRAGPEPPRKWFERERDGSERLELGDLPTLTALPVFPAGEPT